MNLFLMASRELTFFGRHQRQSPHFIGKNPRDRHLLNQQHVLVEEM